ncbi:hypothetical protein FRC08_010693 [Ceratobasidium sp. 394]|nr:hypothetical protein FRC08_010693 [Ceratobasidium sp. 394]
MPPSIKTQTPYRLPPTENGWGTHDFPWVHDPSSFQPLGSSSFQSLDSAPFPSLDPSSFQLFDPSFNSASLPSFDPSSFQSLNPPPSLSLNPPSFEPLDPPAFQLVDPLPTFDLRQPELNDCEFGTWEQGLLQNPWAESTNSAWYGTGDTNVAWHDFATQVSPNGQERIEPNGREGIEARPGPGVTHMGGNASNVQTYIRMVTESRVIYRHSTAGQSYGRGQTRWEAEREKNTELRGGNPYAMWASKDEWEAVKWMATSKVSQVSLNELLKTERFRDAKYSFKNAKTLFKKIEKEMGGFGGPKWNAEDIVLPGAPHDKATLFYRKLDDCADFLFGQARFAGKMSFAPEKHYDGDETTRLYDNPWTADDWNERQKTLPTGTTLGGILLASDSTQLSTHSGDVAAHAVYMSLANTDQSTRASTSENAWILVAYIPKSKFTDVMSTLRHRPKDVQNKILGVLNRRLFHRCMEVITRTLCRPEPHNVVDPEGNIRSVLYELVGYIADLEEQWLVAGLGGLTCPYCARDANHLGDPESGLARTPTDVLRQIRKIKKDYKAAWGRSPSIEEFMNLAGEVHLNGVDKPFWKTLPKLNIFNALSPDLLHGFHKTSTMHAYEHKSNLPAIGPSCTAYHTYLR